MAEQIDITIEADGETLDEIVLLLESTAEIDVTVKDEGDEDDVESDGGYGQIAYGGDSYGS